MIVVFYSIIANSEIEFDRKKPFARILKEGFINTEMNFHSLLSKNRLVCTVYCAYTMQLIVLIFNCIVAF